MKNIAHSWILDLKMYEPGKPIEEVARELGFASVDDIIKLASNENALGPSPLALLLRIRLPPSLKAMAGKSAENEFDTR